MNHRLMATQHPAPQPARDRRTIPYTCEVCRAPVPAGIVDVTGRRRHHWHGDAPDPTDTPQATAERRWDLYNATTPRRKDTPR